MAQVVSDAGGHWQAVTQAVVSAATDRAVHGKVVDQEADPTLLPDGKE
jgi:hypothetical protein